MFLSKYGLKDDTPKYIRTDLGGELARSTTFRDTVAKYKYSLETTGADTSSQNGRGERPHRTLANMVRCLLYSSTLGTEFWSDALVYATYLYNRSHHSELGTTPFQAWTGHPPSIKHLRTFGTPVTVKEPGNRLNKLHPHAYHGLFLRFTGTAKNIVYYDMHSGRVKIATHKRHDEFHYSTSTGQRSKASKHMMAITTDDPTETKFGSRQLEDTFKLPPDSTNFPTQAAAAKMEVPTAKTLDSPTLGRTDTDVLIQKDKDILQLEFSLDVFGPSTTIQVEVDNSTTLGFCFYPGKVTPTIQDCTPHTPANGIRAWRSRFRHGTIRAIDGEVIHNVQQLEDHLEELRKLGKTTCSITIAHEEIWSLHTANGIPQLHFDQLNAIAQHLHNVKHDTDSTIPLMPKTMTPDGPTIRKVIATGTIPKGMDEDTIHNATGTGLIPIKLTRRKIQQLDDWPEWEQAEFKQHDSYATQNMFGEPIPRPTGIDSDGH